MFSIVYEKPFLAYKGMDDNRISTLLKKTGLEDRSYTLENAREKVAKLFETDYSEAKQLLGVEREQALKYLKTALEIE